MRDLLLTVARLSEASDQADEMVHECADGTATAVEATLALSCAYVECQRTIGMVAKRMAELEMAASRMERLV